MISTLESRPSLPNAARDVGGTVVSESALRSAGTLLSRVRHKGLEHLATTGNIK
ncbi:hypothetical protein PoB_004947000, partial [Plakobranchus ocellatus]